MYVLSFGYEEITTKETRKNSTCSCCDIVVVNKKRFWFISKEKKKSNVKKICTYKCLADVDFPSENLFTLSLIHI